MAEVQAVVDETARAALAEAAVVIEQLKWSAAVDELRADGWTVAIHNDYRQNGQPWTFWLLTHPDGCYVKGEGETDALAIAQLRTAIAALESQPYYAVVYRIGESEMREVAFSAEHAARVRETRAATHGAARIERRRSFTGPWHEVRP